MANAITKPRKKTLRPRCKVINRRAVAVARDVLKHLKAWNLSPGQYCILGQDTPHSGELQAVAKQWTRECHVCLLGAAFISKARVFDECNLDAILDHYGEEYHSQSVSRESMTENLKSVFSEDQMDLMECAFECAPGFLKGRNSGLACGAAVFGIKAGRKRNRLKRVMENVILHGGEFRPRPCGMEEYEILHGAFINAGKYSE